MSNRRRRKTSRTRRIDGAEVQQRQAAEASAAFWHGAAGVTPSPEQPDAAANGTADGSAIADAGPGQLPDILTEARRISVTTDPTSTVRSLGKPPLAGREAAAEHYFEAVYQRAVAMAGALAAAGDLFASVDEEFTTS
ncbi:hypothetical protein [Candidatus Poriferisodalis multihospitum]|uniref:hypothetical protein n=1 Tax=Candidatus Poriferisodalis multihospitum TaxID=2983191 RepID=UPI002B2624E1|nr:hypothetical protein [Candidatus Poriferisodalis multihospitum]